MSRRHRKTRPAAFAEPPRKNLPAAATALIANARNDITIPFFSGVLQNSDDTLLNQGGGKGLKIYDEIERDTHAGAMLEKRKGALISREWKVEAGGDRPIDKAAAELAREMIGALPFDQVCKDLLDATLKGYAVSEVVWGRDGNRIKPVKIKSIDQRRFVFDTEWRPRLLTWTAMSEGIELPERKFIVHRVGVKGENPYGLGLGSRLFWPVLFKREGITFWLHFLEKFAGPTIIGKSPIGSLPEEQRKLLTTLQGAVTSSAIVVPMGTDAEFLEASRSGSVTYEQFLNYWDRQISIATTGETLTTQVGESGGNRALGEVHMEMLDMLADGDGDLLSGTLTEQLLQWIVDYNLPGAAVPKIWRERPKNAQAAAATKKSQADAAEATAKAIRTVVSEAARFEDDEVAREYILSFDVTQGLSDKTIDALVEARRAFGTAPAAPDPFVTDDPTFAAAWLKKKSLTHRHVCFAEPGGPVERITDQAIAAAERHFTKRVTAVRKAIETAEDFDAAARAVLEIGATWTPDALAALFSQAMQLAALEGREAVFADWEDVSFAEVDLTRQEFREQIDFLTQKRGKPTVAWTDAMHGDHDRAFVVAGVTDMAMLEGFQQAIIEGARTYDIKAFAAEFDRLVEKYGWSYNGGREWRIRTIFETNIRTSYMAGRLRQMRDPDVVKVRPYWQYRHGETRVPLNPRPEHTSWHNLVLFWNDPWWDTHFPPNDWACSCGVRTLSRGDLRRMGKDGPDKAPETSMVKHIDRATGAVIEIPEGIGYGWDYMPGDLWERGLVPSALLNDGGAILTGDLKGHHVVSIDRAEPMADLIAASVPFTAERMPEGLPEPDYLRAFLEPFGADIGKAALWEDQSGAKIVISEQVFLEHSGASKLMKRGRGEYAALLAEAIMNPDEIWMGVRAVPVDAVSGYFPAYEELMVTRRYIKVDQKTSLQVLFEVGRKAWGAVTGYASFNRAKPDYSHIDKQRVGKLLWKRKRPG